MSRGAQIFGMICFFGILVPYVIAVIYLTSIQSPYFICGFKLFWDGRSPCINELNHK